MGYIFLLFDVLRWIWKMLCVLFVLKFFNIILIVIGVVWSILKVVLFFWIILYWLVLDFIIILFKCKKVLKVNKKMDFRRILVYKFLIERFIDFNMFDKMGFVIGNLEFLLGVEWWYFCMIFLIKNVLDGFWRLRILCI